MEFEKIQSFFEKPIYASKKSQTLNGTFWEISLLIVNMAQNNKVFYFDFI